MKTNRRILFLLVFTTIVISLIGVNPTNVVFAGSNGQHLGILVCQGPVPSETAYSITVSGYNQNGNWVTWSSGWNGSCSFGTSNWWWIGRVNFTVKKMDYGTLVYSQNYYTDVPKNQSSDWYWVRTY